MYMYMYVTVNNILYCYPIYNRPTHTNTVYPVLTHLLGLLYDISHGHDHDILYLEQPLLNSSTCRAGGYGLRQIHLLSFAAEHCNNVEVWKELEFSDSLEAFLEMWLDSCRILCL